MADYGFVSVDAAIHAVAHGLRRALGDDARGDHIGATEWIANLPGVADEDELAQLLKHCRREILRDAGPTARCTVIGALYTPSRSGAEVEWTLMRRLHRALRERPEQNTVELVLADELLINGSTAYAAAERALRALHELLLGGPATLSAITWETPLTLDQWELETVRETFDGIACRLARETSPAAVVTARAPGGNDRLLALPGSKRDAAKLLRQLQHELLTTDYIHFYGNDIVTDMPHLQGNIHLHAATRELTEPPTELTAVATLRPRPVRGRSST